MQETQQEVPKQVALHRAQENDNDAEIEIYRKQKQRDYERQEEEKQKQEKNKKRVKKDDGAKRAVDEEMMKKAYTYDLKGDLLPVKIVNIDTLARDCNFEMRYNTKKAPIIQKGIFSFEKIAAKAD